MRGFIGAFSACAVLVPITVPSIANGQDYYYQTQCYVNLNNGKQVAISGQVFNQAHCVQSGKSCALGRSYSEIIYYPSWITLENPEICAASPIKIEPGKEASYPPPPPPIQLPTPKGNRPITNWTKDSGPQRSGRYADFSGWYTMCSDLLPDGYVLTRQSFILQGDRHDCKSWAACATPKNTATQTCRSFKMQGHSEGYFGDLLGSIGIGNPSHGQRDTRGILTISAAHPMQPTVYYSTKVNTKCTDYSYQLAGAGHVDNKIDFGTPATFQISAPRGAFNSKMTATSLANRPIGPSAVTGTGTSLSLHVETMRSDLPGDAIIRVCH